MCGIAGILRFDGQAVDGAVLTAMTGTLSHRGPDGQGVGVFGRNREAGLGHRRLKIIDLSDAAAQPMAGGGGAVWITFNGEIYNYRELRAALVARGATFQTASDTEVILRLYETEGEKCVAHLDGMFAFAIWDGHRRRLFLARDRVGKKPLFYSATPSLFAFASEIKALLRHPEVPLAVNEAAVPWYFLYGYVPTPESLYQSIVAVPPGHTLTVSGDGHVRLSPYWDLPVVPAGSATPDEPAAAARVRELVVDAVRKRMVADVPVGAFLSGGVDSTVVVGVMSRLTDEPVRTFSIGFDGDPDFDETRYARLAARRFGTRHTEFVVKPRAVDLIETLVWHHDGPFGDCSAIPTYVVSKLTREHVTVALNGDGGDEAFAGYLRFYAGVLAERLPHAWARWAARLLGWLPEGRSYHGPLRRTHRFVRSAAAPFYERYSQWISYFPEDLELLLASDRRPAAPFDRIAYFRQHLGRVGDSTALARLLYLNFKTYLPDDLLVKMDRTTMAHGLEARSPLLDRALLEYVAVLPDHLKLRRGTTKYLLRRAFADLLPTPIRRRGKMGFGVPLATWFRGELQEYLCDLLLAPDARLRDTLDQAYVRRLVDEHLTGTRDHGYRLWVILTFEVWRRMLPRFVAEPFAEPGSSQDWGSMRITTESVRG